MRKKGVRILIAALVCCTLLTGRMPVLAADAKSIDEMTFEELKIAYLELQLEYEKLKNAVETGTCSADGTEEAEAADAAENAEAAEEADAAGEAEPTWFLADAETFQDDIIASYMARAIITDSLSNEEKAALTDDETVSFYQGCVDAETVFYEKYANAEFEDLNLYCLCREYISALDQQRQACRQYEETGDMDAFLSLWNAGYYDRADAILELTDCYGYIFGNVSSMRENTAEKRSIDEASLWNASVDPETVQQVQMMLNGIGFNCGEADQEAGERTIRSIMHFQELYGYTPADGIIDEELIGQLTDALG